MKVLVCDNDDIIATVITVDYFINARSLAKRPQSPLQKTLIPGGFRLPVPVAIEPQGNLQACVHGCPRNEQRHAGKGQRNTGEKNEIFVYFNRMGTLICPYFSIKRGLLFKITNWILMAGLEVNSYLQHLFLLPLPRSLPII